MFQDINRNGVPDSGEAPFANEGLILYDSSGNFVSSTVSAADGSYQFTGVTPATYTVAFNYPSWTALRDGWVPSTTGSLSFRWAVGVSGPTTANLGLRPITTSTTPITTATTSTGTVVNSFDDVVPAQTIADDLSSGSLFGAEGPLTTVDFHLMNGSYYSGQIGGSPGAYSGFHATVYVGWDDWLVRQDFTLFYEYAHAWSGYYSYLVQQDPSLSSYLAVRGLTGNTLLGSSLTWEPVELIADDYRQLFGSPTASAYPQDNTQIPPASQVPGLKAFLSTTFMASPAVPMSAPPPPANLSAVAGNAEVSLTWDASPGATSYTLLRCAGTGCTPSAPVATTTSTAFTDTSVINYTSYSYAVEAVDSVGTSAPSTVAAAEPWTSVQIGGVTVNPLPVNTSAHIAFVLSTAATTTVQVVGNKGKVIATLLNGATEPAGSVADTWTLTAKLRQGTYTLKIIATDPGGHSATANAAFTAV